MTSMENDLSSRFQGLKAIHFSGLNKSRSQGRDEAGWTPARWSIRTGAARDFDMDKYGRLTVPKSGLYYVYAQVKHLHFNVKIIIS